METKNPALWQPPKLKSQQILCFALVLGLLTTLIAPETTSYLSGVVVLHELLRSGFGTEEDS